MASATGSRKVIDVVFTRFISLHEYNEFLGRKRIRNDTGLKDCDCDLPSRSDIDDTKPCLIGVEIINH